MHTRRENKDKCFNKVCHVKLQPYIYKPACSYKQILKSWWSLHLLVSLKYPRLRVSRLVSSLTHASVDTVRRLNEFSDYSFHYSYAMNARHLLYAVHTSNDAELAPHWSTAWPITAEFALPPYQHPLVPKTPGLVLKFL